MVEEGKGEVSACGYMGSLREVDILSEGEDIMVGVSGADVFFDGIYGPDGQEEDAAVRDLEEEEEEDFGNCGICIDVDETLEIEDYGVYRVQQESVAAVESDEIVSCVRALVQSLPLPGQVSPWELVPVVAPLVGSNDSYEKNKCDVINNQSSNVLKRKRESVNDRPKERGSSSNGRTDVVSCSSVPSMLQEFEDFLNESAKYSTAEDKKTSGVEIPVHICEEDRNKNFQNQLSGGEPSMVSSVMELKDSYWHDMVIQTKFPVKLPTDNTSTTQGSKFHKPQSLRFGADHPNKRTTDKYSPGELILTFSDVRAIPSEYKLKNIFRRFGPLIETETLIYQGCARVVFKKSSDAEVAVSSARAFKIMGPSVVKYELGYAPLTAMPAAGVENTTSMLQRAKSEVIVAPKYEPEMINAQDYVPEDIPEQQSQSELLGGTYEIDIKVESEEYEGLDDVDIMLKKFWT